LLLDLCVIIMVIIIIQRRLIRRRNTVTDSRAPYKNNEKCTEMLLKQSLLYAKHKSFNAVLKLFKVAELLMLNGKLSQAAGPATANALSLNFVLVL